MPKAFLVREISSEDTEAIEEISTTARAEAIPSLVEVHDKADRINFYHREISNKSGLVATSATGEPVGFIIWFKQEIDHLYITSAWRGQGIGTQLLNLALSEIGVCPAHLFMFQENLLALNFYQKHGFEVVYTGDGSGNEEHLPDYRLEKS